MVPTEERLWPGEQTPCSAITPLYGASMLARLASSAVSNTFACVHVKVAHFAARHPFVEKHAHSRWASAGGSTRPILDNKQVIKLGSSAHAAAHQSLITITHGMYCVFLAFTTAHDDACVCPFSQIFHAPAAESLALTGSDLPPPVRKHAPRGPPARLQNTATERCLPPVAHHCSTTPMHKTGDKMIKPAAGAKSCASIGVVSS